MAVTIYIVPLLCVMHAVSWFDVVGSWWQIYGSECIGSQRSTGFRSHHMTSVSPSHHWLQWLLWHLLCLIVRVLESVTGVRFCNARSIMSGRPRRMRSAS